MNKTHDQNTQSQPDETDWQMTAARKKAITEAANAVIETANKGGVSYDQMQEVVDAPDIAFSTSKLQ